MTIGHDKVVVEVVAVRDLLQEKSYEPGPAHQDPPVAATRYHVFSQLGTPCWLIVIYWRERI